METFSIALLNICEGNPPVTGGFLSQRPVTRSFDVFFDLRLNKPSVPRIISPVNSPYSVVRYTGRTIATPNIPPFLYWLCGSTSYANVVILITFSPLPAPKVVNLTFGATGTKYPLPCQISKPRNWMSELMYRSEIWQVPQQQCCCDTCYMSEWSCTFKSISRGCETSLDFAKGHHRFIAKF